GDFTVRSCAPRADGRYDLLVDDSVLYPEGGGQPADHGTVAGVAVVDVQKVEGGLLHVALGPVPPGPARVQLDPVRRWDHTQQHSAQHLLTALALQRLGLRTVGFHLGPQVSTIDLDGPLSEADRDRLEAWAEEEVLADRPVTFRVVTAQEYAALDVRSRGLPEGHQGPVRLVEIQGLDVNTCGGTHVTHLGALGLVHIARTERYKGGTRLSFLAGGRARRALAAARDRERALSDLLTCGVDQHLAAVARLHEGLKDRQRQLKQAQAELAPLLGASLVAGEAPGVRHLHRDDADAGFLQAIADAALQARADARLALTGGTGEALFLVAGPATWVAAAGPTFAAALGGRGGGRGERFQGKAPSLAALGAALAALG
ncbi:alanyl-tRNA editing protein, partial [Myxococcota bacterium]|nr:alanyl-tRNA editing protein [Myxococcota bacterium]